jgi:DNA-binding protein Fis
MDKLSSSLKKALLLMVMERYHSDREKACKVLGISQEKLETELKLCGVAR